MACRTGEVSKSRQIHVCGVIGIREGSVECAIVQCGHVIGRVVAESEHTPTYVGERDEIPIRIIGKGLRVAVLIGDAQ